MTDFLDEKRQEIVDRLAELKPLVAEYHDLEAASAALGGLNGAATAPVARQVSGRRGSGRPRGSKTRSSGVAKPATAEPKAPAARPTRGGAGRKVGRRKGSGARSAQALALVVAQPGITISELAARMNIKQNYLYRVLPALQQEGKVIKKGRGWQAKP
ncbi:MAG: hypothetical protein ABSH36_13830 [Solirubrobacteraceae bacterium]